MEKVYINKETGELYLWTNKMYHNSQPLFFYFWQIDKNRYKLQITDNYKFEIGGAELEYLGEL